MYRNHSDPNVMRAVLAQGLKEWQKLPEAERKPGATQVGAPRKLDANYSRALPAGALVLNVYTRILDKDRSGDYCVGTCNMPGADQAARDHLWLTAQDWKALVPKQPRKGDTLPIPNRLVQRIARFHLLDNTRGEPPNWTREEVRTAKLRLTVDEVTPKAVILRLEGSVLLATSANPAEAERGFDVRLLGYLRYDTAKRAFDRFDVVALGEHWGQGPFTHGARPGRTPLGVAFELARGDSPAEQVPPQGARHLQSYWDADRK